MAVLVQRVVPAQYAFVIHTRNPSNNNEDEVFCEMLMLVESSPMARLGTAAALLLPWLAAGESLVSGMIAGSAVAFKANKQDLNSPEVLCYASKSEGMFVPESLIFRSDSNGEDLEGYAGAGLYESITMDTTETRKVDYMDDQLVQDPGFRRDITSRICKVGMAIEQALGSAQDIEGVVGPDGVITIVQTRPQVAKQQHHQVAVQVERSQVTVQVDDAGG
ncbi:PPDK_N domain-containing protein [Haematococcus lacustris]|uniref:PPDK_N domain-containing protein n=1 Tax=Haematococcus lacustris TaxID=44745 RepID=A0A699Y991_HAELA|nr:PPDK_N domain-containing protein [Haematococcus lacustris]